MSAIVIAETATGSKSSAAAIGIKICLMLIAASENLGEVKTIACPRAAAR